MSNAITTHDTSYNCHYSPNGSRYWDPYCDEQFKPYVNQSFKNIEDAFHFYKSYGRLCGFDVRRSSEKKHSDGTIVSKHFVCNKAGYNKSSSSNVALNGGVSSSGRRKTKSARCGCLAKMILRFSADFGYVVVTCVNIHNHMLASTEAEPFMKYNKCRNDGHKSFIFSAANVNIGASKAHSLMKQMVGGYANVGATSTDFRNVTRDVRAYIGDMDAEMIIQKFKDKKELCEDFYYEYDVDDTDSLRGIFWADSISRRNYELFGDVVSFDATFDINK